MTLEAQLAGRYRLERRLGEGGMGVVWLAVQLGLDRPVALKVIGADLAASGEFRERFREEARLASRVVDPHVVRLLDFDERPDGLVYMAYELVECTDLAKHLASGGRLDAARRRAIALDLARAVSAIHAAGVLHRDIKPANVLVAQDGRARLTDLGIACEIASEVRRTRTGMVVGTPDYLAPEQVAGDKPTTATDVYQLGCVFYELLAGRPPFAGRPVPDMLAAHVREAPPPIATQVEEEDPALAAITVQALSKDSILRPTVAAIVHRLEGEAGGRARRVGPAARRRPAPGARGTGRVAPALVVALAACAGVLAMKCNDRPATPAPASASAGIRTGPSASRPTSPATTSIGPVVMPAEPRTKHWDGWRDLAPLAGAPVPDVAGMRRLMSDRHGVDLGLQPAPYLYWVSLGRWLERPRGEPPRSTLARRGLTDLVESRISADAVRGDPASAAPLLYVLRSLTYHPDDARYWFTLGYLLEHERLDDGARAVYRNGLRRLAGEKISTMSALGWAGLVRALRFFEPDDVARRFARHLDPLDTDGAPWLGVERACWFEEHAHHALLRALWAKPFRLPWAALRLGHLTLTTRGDWALARAVWLEAIEAYPGFEPLRFTLFDAALRRGRVEDASPHAEHLEDRERARLQLECVRREPAAGPLAGGDLSRLSETRMLGVEICRRLETGDHAGALQAYRSAGTGDDRKIPAGWLPLLDLYAAGPAPQPLATECHEMLFDSPGPESWLAAAGAFATPGGRTAFEAFAAEAQRRPDRAALAALATALWHGRLGRHDEALAALERVPATIARDPFALLELLARPPLAAAIGQPVPPRVLDGFGRFKPPVVDGITDSCLIAIRGRRFREAFGHAASLFERYPVPPCSAFLPAWCALAAGDGALARTWIARGRASVRYQSGPLFVLRELGALEALSRLRRHPADEHDRDAGQGVGPER